MNFWDAFQDPAESLMNLLNEENPSLKDVVENEHCLGRLRNLDDKLVNFLSQDNIIIELITNALRPKIDPDIDETQQYQYAHRCTEVLSFRVKQFYDSILNNKEATALLSNFLKTDRDNLNPLIVSFYCKIITSLYIHDTPAMIDVFKQGEFLAAAFESLNYSAIYELLVSLSARILPDDRPPVKDWLVSEDFGNRLLVTFMSTNDFITLENVAFLWAEYIKALRDFCYSFETEDELLENIQRHSLLEKLLPHMFPKDGEWDWNVIINGCSILHAYFESSFDFRQPSMDMAKTDMERSRVAVPDPEFVVERLCSQYLSDVLNASLDAFKENDGETMISCLMLVEYVLNTSQTNNHETFVEQLKKFDFKRWILAINENPTPTIAVNFIHNIISYMLHCAYSDEAPLIKYLFEDLDILGLIISCINTESDGFTLIKKKAKDSFLYRLAERIELSQDKTQNCNIIKKYIDGDKNSNEWFKFVENQLKPYLNEHLVEEPASNQTYSDLSGTLDLCVDEFMEEPDETNNIDHNATVNDINSHKDTKDEVDEFATTFPKTITKNEPMDVDDWPTTSSDASPNDLEDMFAKLRPSKVESSNMSKLESGDSKEINAGFNLNDTDELLNSLPNANLNDTDEFLNSLSVANSKKAEDDWPTTNESSTKPEKDLFIHGW